MPVGNLDKFISEQKDYFEQNLHKNGDKLWEDNFWLKGTQGASWLSARGKASIRFDEINKVKGLENISITQDYQDFCKAMLVYSFRKANSVASPQKLQSELLVLKRWYYSLKVLTETTNPIKLTTEVINHAFSLLEQTNSAVNLPDYVGAFKRMQDIVNKQGITARKLDFDVGVKYINKQNRTPKARLTKELLEDKNIDENKLNAEKLISIQTFINIASLKNLCQNDGEKILLNFLFLSIITGFRSTETIMLKTDCLVEKPILNPMTDEPIIVNGNPRYNLGIQYYGAKGAGKRIHWVEPSSVTLVKSIVKSILQITEPYRVHLRYLRNKNLKDFLPQSIDEISNEFIELDDFIDHLFISKQRSRGRAGKRDAILKILKNRDILLGEMISNGQSEQKFYSKTTLNRLIESTADYNSDEPINKKFDYEGELINIPYEDLLFIAQQGSTTLSRTIIHKAIIIPLDIHIINNFLGSGKNKSVFEKYELRDSNKNFSKISSHIPRHNINTFLAIAEISDHLQTMLMGRVDIEQNKYYQHLNVKQISQQSSLTTKIRDNQNFVDLITTTDVAIQEYENVLNPIDAVLEYGLMLFNDKKDLENNIKNNLHTFDSRNEISTFIERSIDDNYFDDIANAFKEISVSEPNKAKELVETHAYLHPLPFGSCMRNITTHGCPKRLACQSGLDCVNFTVTGRMGEIETLTNIKNRLIEQGKAFKDDCEFKIRLKEQIINLERFERKIMISHRNKIPLNIYQPLDTELSQPKTLAELFSLEYEKIKTEDEED